MGLRNGAHRQGRIGDARGEPSHAACTRDLECGVGLESLPGPPALVLALRNGETEARDARLGGTAELDAPDRSERDDHRVWRLGIIIGMHVQRDHPEARLGLDLLEHEARAVGELDLDHRRLDAVRFAERRDRPVQTADELFVRAFRDRRPDAAAQKSFASCVEAPICPRPSVVIVRPRGVRWMYPSCRRYGS